MKAKHARHRRRSIRLRDYDYSQPGAYYFTICVKDGGNLLGDVKGDMVALSTLGMIVKECWHRIPRNFKAAVLDAFVIMPNHIHGIIHILKDGRGEACASGSSPEGASRPAHASPLRVAYGTMPGSLGAIVQNFKSVSTRKINHDRRSSGPFWQRSYYERVIRDAEELARIRVYIIENPLKWSVDPYYSCD